MSHLKFLIRSLIAVMIFFGMSSSPVSACTPPTRPPDYVPSTIEDHVNDAGLVLIGTVVGGMENGYEITEAEIEVERYLKGEGSAIVTIQRFGHTAGCLARVSIGDTFIFFADGNNSDDTLTANYFDFRRPFVTVNEENVERVIAVTNQSTAPNPLPITVQIERAIENPLSWKLLAILLSGIMLTILAGFKLRGGNRKTKAKRS